jgi:hypothetical protein
MVMTDKVKVSGQVDICELFDNTVGYDDDTGIKLAQGLTDDEIQQAVMFYRVFNELMGLLVIFGDPGTGKDTLLNYLLWKIKHFFPWKRVLRDEKPRPLFGAYGGLFNEQVIADDLARMRAVAKKAEIKDFDSAMDKAVDDWVAGSGQVLLKNSVIGLTEFWKYCYNREPHKPINKAMGGIHKVKRHLDTLIIGCAQMESDLDKRTCKPFIDWKVTCYRAKNTNPMLEKATSFSYFVQKVTYDKRNDILIPLGRPSVFGVDAGKPRTYLGDGIITIRKPHYEPETVEEKIVLTVLRAGINIYEEICDVLADKGDMQEYEVLNTLKSLRFGKDEFGKYKRAISFNCFFDTFNSKSSPQLKTSISVSD